ncbi:Hsp33 protein [Seminavis robusta]|uniref:Hsp33 protein n=1 Tax=Seminavis robusta TaxID=568900 RepID=A0A9N8EM62_9STRA|nr:Hsp33 protein [Seminavis robusta]|eukprot:Sro1524_g279640.1 Hsp33 protein (86) ;mRNA; r:16312-16569
MSSTDSDDPWAGYCNKNNIADQVVSAISKDGRIKVTACTIRNMVNDLMIQHTMTIQAIGRTDHDLCLVNVQWNARRTNLANHSEL